MLNKEDNSQTTKAGTPSGRTEKTDIQETAIPAALVHTSDAGPGITRRRAGKGFFYRDRDGQRISDRETLGRIRSLAIPPAWSDVWICPLPHGHIQATGRDARGRKQYRYHPAWNAYRDSRKYASLSSFAQALPDLRKSVDADLRRRGLPREKVVATVVWLLDHTMIRIGNRAYQDENGSFGLTTLRSRHLHVEGSKLRFAFRGKSGKDQKLTTTNRRVAKIVRGIQDLPGQALFQYLDEDERRQQIDSTDVNGYIHAKAGSGFSAKDFRTWGGTVRAAELLAGTELPETKREVQQTLNAVIDQVARRLGNTRAVCRRCYIHPQIIEDWRNGRLQKDMARISGSTSLRSSGLDRQEAIVLKWLKQRTE